MGADGDANLAPAGPGCGCAFSRAGEATANLRGGPPARERPPRPPVLRRGRGRRCRFFFFVWIKPPKECTTGVGTVDENKCQITFKRPRKREEASVLSTRSRQNRLRLQVPPSQPKGIAGRAPRTGSAPRRKQHITQQTRNACTAPMLLRIYGWPWWPIAWHPPRNETTDYAPTLTGAVP